MKSSEIANVMFRLAAIMLGFGAIYWLLLKITGHSPTFEQILLILITAFTGLGLSLLIKNNGELKELKGRFQENAKNNDRRFDEIERKFDQIERKFEGRFEKFDNKFDVIGNKIELLAKEMRLHRKKSG